MFFHHRGLQSDVDIILEACDIRALDIASRTLRRGSPM
jgi:hypothetical protein